MPNLADDANELLSLVDEVLSPVGEGSQWLEEAELQKLIDAVVKKRIVLRQQCDARGGDTLLSFALGAAFGVMNRGRR